MGLRLLEPIDVWFEPDWEKFKGDPTAYAYDAEGDEPERREFLRREAQTYIREWELRGWRLSGDTALLAIDFTILGSADGVWLRFEPDPEILEKVIPVALIPMAWRPDVKQDEKADEPLPTHQARRSWFFGLGWRREWQ